MDDSYVDIYSEIYDTDITEQFQKLQQENVKLTTHVNVLESDNKRLTEEISKLKLSLEALTKNISELFNTAKNELLRKDRMISMLRDELQTAQHQNKNYGSYRKQHMQLNSNKRLESCEQLDKAKDKVIRTTESRDKDSISSREHNMPNFNSERTTSRSRDDGASESHFRECLEEPREENKADYRYGKFVINSKINNDRYQDKSRERSERDRHLKNDDDRSHERGRYTRDGRSKERSHKSEQHFVNDKSSNRDHRRRSRHRSYKEADRCKSPERSSREKNRNDRKPKKNNKEKYDEERKVSSKSSNEGELNLRRAKDISNDVSKHMEKDLCHVNGKMPETSSLKDPKFIHSGDDCEIVEDTRPQKHDQEEIMNTKQYETCKKVVQSETASSINRQRIIDDYDEHVMDKPKMQEAFEKKEDIREFQRQDDARNLHEIHHQRSKNEKEQTQSFNSTRNDNVNVETKTKETENFVPNRWFSNYPQLHVIELNNDENAPDCPELLTGTYLLSKDETELLSMKSDILKCLKSDIDGKESPCKKRSLSESDSNVTVKKTKIDFDSNNTSNGCLKEYNGEDPRLRITSECNIEKSSSTSNRSENNVVNEIELNNPDNLSINSASRNVEDVTKDENRRQSTKANLIESNVISKTDDVNDENRRIINLTNANVVLNKKKDVLEQVTETLRVLDGSNLDETATDSCNSQIRSTYDLINCLKTPPYNKNSNYVDETDTGMANCKSNDAPQMIGNILRTSSYEYPVRNLINSTCNMKDNFQDTMDSSQDVKDLSQDVKNSSQDVMDLSSNINDSTINLKDSVQNVRDSVRNIIYTSTSMSNSADGFGNFSQVGTSSSQIVPELSQPLPDSSQITTNSSQSTTYSPQTVTNSSQDMMQITQKAMSISQKNLSENLTTTTETPLNLSQSSISLSQSMINIFDSISTSSSSSIYQLNENSPLHVSDVTDCSKDDNNVNCNEIDNTNIIINVNNDKSDTELNSNVSSRNSTISSQCSTSPRKGRRRRCVVRLNK